jgi:hypothetical protein
LISINQNDGHNVLKNKLGAAFLFLLTCLPSSALYAEDFAQYGPTANMMGELGLNTIPSARMSPEGSARLTVSRMAQYTNAAIGFQMTDRLYLGLRQTSESKNFNSETLHLYPGMDAKWMLYPEKRFVPQISVGLQSAFGHKRMAAEYLAMSKRYEDFDFTFGFGWGRLATRGGLPNLMLFNNLNSGKSRDIDGESPNKPSDWFKGDMALFGGIEYTTPINGLSLKTDWNSDGWQAEKKSNTDFDAPAPWSVGFSYRPVSWMDTGIAYAGNNTVMARVTFTGNVGQWPWSDSADHTPINMLPHRPEMTMTEEDDDDEDTPSQPEFATEEGLGLTHIFITSKVAEANITLKENTSTPRQIGDAARYLSNIAGETPEQIILHIRSYGLRGIDITLNRTDLERAFLKHQGSTEEIWQTTSFVHDGKDIPLSQVLAEMRGAKPEEGFKLNVLNDVSLSEEDSGLLYRTALGLSYSEYLNRNFLSFISGRLNLRDNLEKLNDYRGVSLMPVRGDIDKFTENRVLIDRNYFMGLATMAEDLHIASAIGYLEEMYMGLSGEVLYRPFDKNWAIGIESALAFKRDPYTFSALAPNGDHILSGFLNTYYEVPNTGTTIKASVGRFLAGDVGGTLGVSNEFKNGVKLSANISASNYSDRDVYGGKTNVYTGIQVSLPLGNLSFMPNGSRIITNAAPLGRDTAQRLDNPTDLYERTEALSYRHITRQWSQFSPVQTARP